MKQKQENFRCVVCIKQVPDTKQVTGQAMRDDGTINRAALPTVFNPDDRNALEAALRVRDARGGKVIVVTMGLPASCAILREAMECGADEAYLITDRRAAASDTLATSYILSCAMRKLNPDMVFCGYQAIDGDTAQVGPQIAEKLDFTLVAYIESLKIENGAAEYTRNIGTGIEHGRAHLPALFTVTGRAPSLRPMSVRRIMKFKKARAAVELGGDTAAAEALAKKDLLIKQWTLDDIEADLAWCGKMGSPTNVHKVQSVVLTGDNYKEISADDAGIEALVAMLVSDHTIG